MAFSCLSAAATSLVAPHRDKHVRTLTQNAVHTPGCRSHPRSTQVVRTYPIK